MTEGLSRQSGTRKSDSWAIVGLLLLAVGLPLAVSVLAGSTQIPRNDDWSYRHIAVAMESTGGLILDGITETMVVGQILLTQPLLWMFDAPVAFAIAGAVFAIAGILGAYALTRQVLPIKLAVIAAGTLAIFPGYLAYSTSYMSDVPAMAAEFFCLTAGALAVKARPVRTAWLVVAAVLGVLAFSIREFGIAAPVAVSVAALCAEPRRRRHWVLGAVTVASCVAIHLWRSSLAGQLPALAPMPAEISTSILALTSVAFVVLPAALVAAIRWRSFVRRKDVVIGLEIGAIVVGARIVQWVTGGGMPRMFINNVTSQFGVPSDGYLLGPRPLLFSDLVWVAANLLALLAFVVVVGIGAGIAGVHLRRCRGSARVFIVRLGSTMGVVTLFCLAVVAGLVVFGLTRNVYDRYYWPLVPPLAALLLFVPGDLTRIGRHARRPSDVVLGIGAIAAAAVLAIGSITYLLNSHAFDAARWHAGEHLVQAGVPADRIDAGYEWRGYYASSQGDPTSGTITYPFYRGWWPDFQECGIVSSDPAPPPGAVLVGTMTYKLHLVFGPTETIYLYRVDSPLCNAR